MEGRGRKANETDVIRFLNYVAQMCKELEELARKDGLHSLGYFLGVARLEAEDQIDQLSVVDKTSEPPWKPPR